MFKRLTIATLVLLAIFAILGKGAWDRAQSPDRGFYTVYPAMQIDHYAQELNGRWSGYRSLQAAWHAEEPRLAEVGSEGTPTDKKLPEAEAVFLPSDSPVTVAAKYFVLPSRWGARTTVLTLEGVYGQAAVYLNGVDSSHLIGQIDGLGGAYKLDIEGVRFNYTKENVLFIGMKRSSQQTARAFGTLTDDRGYLTGAVRLEAVPDVSVSWEDLSYVYDSAQKQILVQAILRHHTFKTTGPWEIRGELLWGEEVVAECLLPVNDSGDEVQSVNLVFAVPEAHLWSPEQPQMYELRLSLDNDRGSSEGLQAPCGVAAYAQTADGGWLLNDQPFSVRGTVLSAEEAARLQGENSMEAYLKALKEQGFNVVYITGFLNESWLTAADGVGIGIWGELPVRTLLAADLPAAEDLSTLLILAKRHPSLMAWTALRGGEAGAGANASYMEAMAALSTPRPVYELSYKPGEGLRQLSVAAGATALQGAWGEITAPEVSTGRAWPLERVLAITGAVLLLVLEFINLRQRSFSYNDLFAKLHIRRWVLKACFLRFLTLGGRLAVLAGLFVHALGVLPLAANPWLPYAWDFLAPWQELPPTLLWFLLSSLLLSLRMLQLGIAAPAFPHVTPALALACWLERRNGWSWLAALGWVWVSFGGVWWSALALYAGLLLLFWPVRLRDFWRLKVRYRSLWRLPLIGLLCLLVLGVCYWRDVLYLYQLW